MLELNITLTIPGAAVLSLLAACAAHQRISYQQDIAPILERNCLECHKPPDGTGYLKSGLKMDSYSSLMKGTAYGPVILPGNSRRSILNMLVEERLGTSMRTPHPLAAQEIKKLKLWVEQGAMNN